MSEEKKTGEIIPLRMTDQQMLEIEKHIKTTLRIGEGGVSPEGKQTVIWLLRQTENLTKTAGIIVPLGTEFREEVFFAFHTLCSCCFNSQIGEFLENMGSYFYPRFEESEIMGWGLTWGIDWRGEFDKVYRVSCPAKNKVPVVETYDFQKFSEILKSVD